MLREQDVQRLILSLCKGEGSPLPGLRGQRGHGRQARNGDPAHVQNCACGGSCRVELQFGLRTQQLAPQRGLTVCRKTGLGESTPTMLLSTFSEACATTTGKKDTRLFSRVCRSWYCS